ncbi:unnamed protein product [Adineta steineri]|uniref:Uncharacterized protein n=1 Tax=Adineta steineri TaxID=433720 RepID=A0A819QZW8_9BILA|nr:unnamed protein product [Adineta steineri]CAF4043766.1 unnamed protein product [Adineta steineri]
MSAYVNHHRDLHSHSRNIRLICSCGGSFGSLRSLQTHWWRFHNEEKGNNDNDIEFNELEESAQEDLSCLINQEAVQDLDFQMERNNLSDENKSPNSTSETGGVNDEEQLELFEKRVLFMLLTLQSVFYTPETAINYVVESLTELFLAISTKHLTLTKKQDIKIVNYTYVPFLISLEKYLRLPEVQADLHRATTIYDPNCIQDVHDGTFARNHSDFQNPIYLKIELNSDDLTITNLISHRAHSIFFFYWSLLNGVLPNHLNAFLDFCVNKGYFRLEQFCLEVNNFPYCEGELSSKPHLGLAFGDLKKQNNLGMPLTSMQTYNLFINLPFILKKLLQSSNFIQYRAILICVDILSICFATNITNNTHLQLSNFIKVHNELFRQLYPGKMKFKFHFMTHFPEMMKNFGPLAYTSCLATERKHQFFKGNKVRNLKNPSLMLARRHELWISVKDHVQNGSLSPNALSDIPYGHLDDRQTINDGQIQFVILNMPNLTFKPLSTLKTFISHGQKYSHGTILNLSTDYFPDLPIVGKIRWILYDGKNCAFICEMYKVKGYVQELRAFEVEEISGASLRIYLISR